MAAQNGLIQGEDCLHGGGEMGRLMRVHDWPVTPVGPVACWPQGLKTAVQILLNSRYPMFVWWGPELAFFYNDAYRPTLGPKHPSALGRSAAEVWAEIWETIGPQTDAVLYRGQATWNEELLLFLERNGYPEETYHTFSYSPVANDQGGVGGVFCAVTEETQRVLGRRRLRTLRELAARTTGAKTVEDACRAAEGALAGNPHDLPFCLIYLIDGEGKTATLAGSTGMSTGSSACPMTIDLTDSAVGEAYWPLGEVLASGEAVFIESLGPEMGTLEGGVWPEPPSTALALPVKQSVQDRLAGFLVTGISPRRAYDDDYRGFLDLLAGQIAAAVANARAYEEERRRAESLAELDRAKTAFFSNVSHEFRTPLTLLLGPVEDILSRSERVDPEDRELLALVHRNALRLQKLVNTLLDFSRIEAGRVQASYQPTDIATLTAELASNFRSACERANLELQVDCPPLSEPVYIDHDMWEKIVLNLLSNAFKFTLQGRIEVRLRAEGRRAQLEVRDSGTGIRPEEMPRLFERFHRVEQTRGRTQEGSGIGLALVRELVRLHGGDVRAESVVSQGSVFTVSIPLGSAHLPVDRVGISVPLTPPPLSAAPYVEEALRWLPDSPTEMAGLEAPNFTAAAIGPLRTSTPPPVSGNRPQILLADDNSDVREYVRRLLADRYEVTTVADGRTALAVCRERKPDLVLSDVMMPGLDGFGLLRALRADPRTRELPILLLSARAGEEARVEGLEAGADDYLTKPFNARELLACVRSNIEMATLRRESEASLRASQERLNIALAASGTGTFRWDPNTGEFLDFDENMKRLVGLDPAEPVKFTEDFMDRLHPDDVAHILPAVERSRQGADFEMEFRIVLPNGEIRWLYDRGRMERDPEGNPTYLVGACTDVTTRKRGEEALREADRRKDEFLATLAHELRNPLAPIRNALHLMKQPASDNQGIEAERAMAERQVVHLARLIDDLMDVARISRGKIQLHKQVVDLATIVREAVETARPSIDERRHHLTLSLPDEPIRLEADPTRLEQVLCNLLNNAAKYTEPGGQIRLAVHRQEGDVVLEIRDTGIGIATAMLSKVFEIFVQAADHKDHAQGGLGIGLSLVRTLVEMHGGSIEATSAGKGQGSEFVVKLPALPQSSSDGAVSDGQPRDAREGPTRHRILVVDDNADAARSLARVLERLYAQEVRVAHSGPEALDAAQAFQPEIVLLDIGLPGMNGYQVAAKLRERPELEDILIVALTGWGQDEDRRRSKIAGFDLHLVKPVSPDELLNLLAGALPARKGS